MEQSIPVLNLSDFDDPSRRDEFVGRLGDAFRNFGFAALEGHGVPSELIETNYALFRDFFALSGETKRRYEHPQDGRQRGYTSFGVEHAKQNAAPDLKEFWHHGREGAHPGLPQNVWPRELPELRERAVELFLAMDGVAQRVLAAISLYLGRDEGFLPALAQGGNSVTRVIHYPVCDGFDQPGAMRSAEHEDINLITLLPEATQSGLELLTTEGVWLPIPSLPGQLVVDTGDMMSRLTNGMIPARTHRVVNPQGVPTARYSMPHFCHPRPDASLAVLPECVPEGEEPKFPPVTADEYLKERLREIGVA